MEKIISALAAEFKLPAANVKNTVTLIEDGNTIPFIARYRKEATGNMSDELLRALSERLGFLKNLSARKEEVIRLIDKQEKLTDELRQKIEKCESIKDIDDIYLPFRPKKRTRAVLAVERGLSPLAEFIFSGASDELIRRRAEEFIDSERGVADIQSAIGGAGDILAERISETAEYRGRIREMTMKYGMLGSAPAKGMEQEVNEFAAYYDYRESIRTIADHRVLALNRGEDKGVLKVTLEAPVDTIIAYLHKMVIKEDGEIIRAVIADSYKRLLAPSIERECRAELSARAEESAIGVFAKNLRALLLAPPLHGKVIMGLDPAFRTGCKIAVIDANGKFLDYTTIYPTVPQKKIRESMDTLCGLIEKYGVEVISIGNGTASRESEAFVADMISERHLHVQYEIVNEAGASVYSASELATAEYPELNVSIRGAVSIAQRLADPLAELVKIDPKHIGVGQYQHDVNQKRLGEALDGVVEGAVNSVGVNVNTASPALLERVAGITKRTAANIYEYVKETGGIKSRSELMKVSGIGAKAYEQCAGFLRVPQSSNVLDSTAVHPESYDTARRILELVGSRLTLSELREAKAKLSALDTAKLSAELEVGEYTLKDIIAELQKPGRDPREEVRRVSLNADVTDIKDLREGMRLTGTVRNVVSFGAFVDIGVHKDGLVHISKLSDRYVTDPFSVVSIGDIVNVEVIEVDRARSRIMLSMKGLSD